HAYYKPPSSLRGGPEARVRAAGWRCAQALQWAASSAQAGLGYLVRQAIRAKWTMRNATLAECIAALRPYRLGAVDEPIQSLYDRIQKEVSRQVDDGDVEDIEDEESGSASEHSKAGLESLLSEGLAVIHEAADCKWDVIYKRLLEPAGAEKVV